MFCPLFALKDRSGYIGIKRLKSLNDFWTCEGGGQVETLGCSVKLIQLKTSFGTEALTDSALFFLGNLVLQRKIPGGIFKGSRLSSAAVIKIEKTVTSDMLGMRRAFYPCRVLGRVRIPA